MPCPNPLLNTHQCTTSVVYAIIDYSYTATSQILQTKHHPIAHTKTRSKMKTGDSMLGWLSSITHVLCFTHDTSRWSTDLQSAALLTVSAARSPKGLLIRFPTCDAHIRLRGCSALCSVQSGTKRVSKECQQWQALLGWLLQYLLTQFTFFQCRTGTDASRTKLCCTCLTCSFPNVSLTTLPATWLTKWPSTLLPWTCWFWWWRCKWTESHPGDSSELQSSVSDFVRTWRFRG